MPNFINNKISLVRHKIQHNLINNYTLTSSNDYSRMWNVILRPIIAVAIKGFEIC